MSILVLLLLGAAALVALQRLAKDDGAPAQQMRRRFDSDSGRRETTCRCFEIPGLGCAPVAAQRARLRR